MGPPIRRGAGIIFEVWAEHVQGEDFPRLVLLIHEVQFNEVNWSLAVEGEFSTELLEPADLGGLSGVADPFFALAVALLKVQVGGFDSFAGLGSGCLRRRSHDTSPGGF